MVLSPPFQCSDIATSKSIPRATNLSTGTFSIRAMCRADHIDKEKDNIDRVVTEDGEKRSHRKL